MNKLYNYFEKLDLENKFSQAFLIGNVYFNDIKDELYNIFNDFLFKNGTNLENNPDIYLLGIDEESISKDDIKNLLSNLSTTSQFNNIKVYVIDKCETLNTPSCNALLKTIEEPQKGIYAFLLTNNMDNVIPTIVSRCQKVFISSNSNIDNEFELLDISNEVINSIETDGIKTIANNSNLYNLIEDRSMLLTILNNILNIYNETLINLVNDKGSNNLIAKKNSIDKISKKILIINDNINRVNNSLNKNLSIDRFIIEMWRCNK